MLRYIQTVGRERFHPLSPGLLHPMVSIDQIEPARRDLSNDNWFRDINSFNMGFVDGGKLRIEIFYLSLFKRSCAWVVLDEFDHGGDVEFEETILEDLIVIFDRER